jgi:hypothetical protein
VEIEIYVIPCGQGDTIILHLLNKSWVLIDCNLPQGTVRDAFFKKVELLGIQRFDVICLTHPHGDHFAGMRQVLEHFTSSGRSVGHYCDSGPTSRQFRDMLKGTSSFSEYKSLWSSCMRIPLGSNFDTNSIIDAIQRWIPPAHWLMDTFFPYDRISDSDNVQLEYYKHGRMIGGFVKPEKRGIARPRKPYISTVYSPPTVKLIRDLDAMALAKRRIGRSQYDGGSTDGEILSEDTMELINEIINLHEWMCSQLQA